MHETTEGAYNHGKLIDVTPGVIEWVKESIKMIPPISRETTVRNSVQKKFWRWTYIGEEKTRTTVQSNKWVVIGFRKTNNIFLVNMAVSEWKAPLQGIISIFAEKYLVMDIRLYPLTLQQAAFLGTEIPYFSSQTPSLYWGTEEEWEIIKREFLTVSVQTN